MDTRHNYQLRKDISMAVFLEKTQKVAFGQYIDECGGVIRPSRVITGEFEDVAYFEQGDFEYELPNHLWKYFEEVGEVKQPESRVATVSEMTGDTATSLAGNFSIKGKPSFMTLNKPVEPTTLHIQAHYVNLDSIKEVDTSTPVEPTDREVFAFFVEKVALSKAEYCVAWTVGLSTEEVLEKTRELYKLDQRLNALAKLKNLIHEEEAKLTEQIDPFYEG